METSDYLDMLDRMLVAAAVRVGLGDQEEFRKLVRLEAKLDAILVEAVRGLRSSGLTWQEIGDAVGTSRQAAHQRWAGKAGDTAA